MMNVIYHDFSKACYFVSKLIKFKLEDGTVRWIHSGTSVSKKVSSGAAARVYSKFLQIFLIGDLEICPLIFSVTQN